VPLAPGAGGASLLPQKGILVCTALLTFLKRLGCSVMEGCLLEFEETCPSACSSSSAGSGVLRRCAEGFGCWATWRRTFDEGIRLIPMLACRTPTAGRRCGCCCWGAALFGAETLRALRGKEEGVLHPMLALHRSYTTTVHTHLGAALDLGEPCWVGFGTGSPASTDDWREVGGSIAGCCTG
jgi:hypothetical protein